MLIFCLCDTCPQITCCQDLARMTHQVLNRILLHQSNLPCLSSVISSRFEGCNLSTYKVLWYLFGKISSIPERLGDVQENFYTFTGVNISTKKWKLFPQNFATMQNSSLDLKTLKYKKVVMWKKYLQKIFKISSFLLKLIIAKEFLSNIFLTILWK